MLRLVLLLLFTAAATGCAPLTRYRQTLLTLPASPPTSLGAPLEEGVVAGGGWVAGYSGVDEAELVADRDTPGVLVPFGSYGGQLRAGLAPHVELGASFERAGAEGARRSAVGVLPLRGAQTAMAFGAHTTVGHSWPSGFGVGVTLDAALLSLPWSRYELRQDAGLVDRDRDPADAALYDHDDSGTVRPIRLRLSQGVSYRRGPLDLAVALAVAPQTTNRGFSDDLPKVLLVGPISLIPAAEAGLRLGNVRLASQLWYATRTGAASRGAYLGLGGRVLAEVHLDRW